MRGLPGLVLAGLVLTGCTGVADGSTTGSTAESSLTVLAAASLTDVLELVVADLEADLPGLTIATSYAASSTIVAQVNEGAPADVIVLAGTGPLEHLLPTAGSSGQELSEPTIVAVNALVLAVPPDNPGDVHGAGDLATPGLRLLACQPGVPCGDAAATVLAQVPGAQVSSFEPDVRAVLAKVRLGEADVGLVYRTDVAAAGDDVLGIELPAELAVTTRYPALALTDDPLARAVLTELTSDRGRAHLLDAGFTLP